MVLYNVGKETPSSLSQHTYQSLSIKSLRRLFNNSTNDKFVVLATVQSTHSQISGSFNRWQIVHRTVWADTHRSPSLLASTDDSRQITRRSLVLATVPTHITLTYLSSAGSLTVDWDGSGLNTSPPCNNTRTVPSHYGLSSVGDLPHTRSKHLTTPRG